MARSLRVEFSGALYNVMTRGNERCAVFARDTDRHLWLATLAEMVEGFGVVAHCYCLMDNHYHLVLATPPANLRVVIGWFQTTFTVRFNRRRCRSGHIFQGRFKAHVEEHEGHARELLRYVRFEDDERKKHELGSRMEKWKKFIRHVARVDPASHAFVGGRLLHPIF